MSSGRGATLGAALVDLFETGGRAGGRRASYTAVGWQAKFSQLTKTKAGYAAMERAGVSATIRTQRGWLSGDTVPPGSMREKIEAAYAAMAGGFAPAWRTAKYEISGRVTIGHDSRERGSGRHAPLRVAGRDGDWDPVERAWDEGKPPDVIEQLYVKYVVEPSIGQTSEPVQFDGFWYEVTT